MADNNLTSTVSGIGKKHHLHSNITINDNNKFNKVLVNNTNQSNTSASVNVNSSVVPVTTLSVSTSTSTNNHMHNNNSMKKKTSFQITSVTVGSSRLSNDGGDDSADDLDESHTDDISRITDNETPSFSEDTLSRDEAVVSTVIPTSAQYGLAILPEGASTVQIPSNTNHSVPNSVNTTANEEIVGSPSKSNPSRANTPNKEHAPEVPAPQRSERFKVVKIESTEPFRRGRWMCMDYLDHSANQPHNSPFFKPINDVPLNGIPQTTGPSMGMAMAMAPPQTLPVVQNGTMNAGVGVGAGATTNFQPARIVAAVPTKNSPVQQQATNQQQQQQQPQPQQIVTSGVQQSQSVPPQQQPQTIIQQPSSNIQSQPQPPPPTLKPAPPNHQKPPKVPVSSINVQQSSSASVSTSTQATPPTSIGGGNAPTSIGINQQTQVAPIITQTQIPAVTQAQTQTTCGVAPPTYEVYQYMNQPFTNMMPVVTSSGMLIPQNMTTTSKSKNTVAPTYNTAPSTNNNMPAPPPYNIPPPTNNMPPPPTSSSGTQTSMISPVPPVTPLTAVTSASVSTSTNSIPTPPLVTNNQTQTQPQPQQAPGPGQTYAGHPMSTQQMPVQAQSYAGQQIQHQFKPPQNYPQNMQQVNNGSNRWTTTSMGGAGDNTPSAQLSGGIPTSVGVSGAPFTYPTTSSVFQGGSGGGGTPVVQQAPNIIKSGATSSGGGAASNALNASTSTTGLTRTPSLSNIQQHSGPAGDVANAATSTKIIPSMTPQQHAAMLSQVQQQAAQMLMVTLSPTTTGANVEPQTLIAAINTNQLISGGGGGLTVTISTGAGMASANSDTLGSGTGTNLIRTTDNCTNTTTPSNPAAVPEDESATAASTVAIDNKIEQAMDLVKSHLMFAVREEVEVLKEKIAELMDRITQLELENSILKANASAEVLQQLPSPLSSTNAIVNASTNTISTNSVSTNTGIGPGTNNTGSTMISSLTKSTSTAPFGGASTNVINVAPPILLQQQHTMSTQTT